MKDSFGNYNIVLVNLDGLRRDKFELCTSLVELKNNSLYFSNMITVSPYTLTSLHAIMSGMHPSKNGVDAYYHMFRFKKNEIITIAELLKRTNYFTYCDVISENIIPTKGFDVVTTFDEKTVDFKKRHSEIIKNLAKDSKKFFLFLHYEGLHSRLISDVLQKYDPKINDDEYFQNKIENENRYNSYLIDCDEYVKTLLNTIKDSSIANNTILIVFSDHGTSIGEKKGEKFYGVYVYDYTLQVFCIIYKPLVQPLIINSQCRTIDIFPTIAELAGITLGDEFKMVAGESLFRLLENPNDKREVFVETGGLYGYWPSPKKHNVFCVRVNDKKLIYNDTPRKWEFYDLKTDPYELHNIYNENSADVKILKERLLFYLKTNEIDTSITNLKESI